MKSWQSTVFFVIPMLSQCFRKNINVIILGRNKNFMQTFDRSRSIKICKKNSLAYPELVLKKFQRFLIFFLIFSQFQTISYSIVFNKENFGEKIKRWQTTVHFVKPMLSQRF